ncbi:hypothetical protein JCM10908_001429 [Rhodotorula pacifica]|uniref:uncharacterized protein n=1 Tax=Rhodotorula pacifica TaxID=1495444 RepID=UPI0031749CCA
MVLLPSAVGLFVAAHLAHAAIPSPQLYIHPSPFPPSFVDSQQQQPLVLTAPQTNAVLAHHLGVERHVSWPVSAKSKQGGAGSREWELALGGGDDVLSTSAAATQQRVVIVLECGKQGCDDAAIPSHLLLPHRPIHLPHLAPNSYLAALSLHLHRLADSLGLQPSQVQGLNEFVREGIKAVKGWQGWVSEELGTWIGWHDEAEERGGKFKAAMVDEPKRDNAGLLSDLDFLDASAKQLILDLDKLATLTDSVSHKHADENKQIDSGAQGRSGDGKPAVTVIHLTGLKDVAAKHSRSSEMYQRSATLLQRTLTATLAAIAPPPSSSSDAEAKVILLALPEPKTPLLRRRKPWLEAFEDGAGGKQVRGVGVAARRAGVAGEGGLEKRNVFSPSTALVRRAQADDADKGSNATYLVPSSYTCFPSLSALKNATASCLSHGQPVRGLTTRTDLQEGEECWVCRCGETRDEETGKRTRWTGEGCEKVDLSADFALLSLSTLGLLVVVALSIGLLYSIGAQELPGTLGAVGGDGGRLKRD